MTHLTDAMSFPKIIRANSDPSVETLFVPLPEDDVFVKIADGKTFAHFFGIVTYSDIFGEQRKTTFRYRWHPEVFWEDDEATDMQPLVIETASWQLVGLGEDNGAT